MTGKETKKKEGSSRKKTAKKTAAKEPVKISGKSIIPRGRIFTGKVISDRMNKTVTVEWPRKLYIPKFERYLKKKSRVKAHNPEHINAKTGDIVKIMETRPISKTKKFMVIEIVKRCEE